MAVEITMIARIVAGPALGGRRLSVRQGACGTVKSVADPTLLHSSKCEVISASARCSHLCASIKYFELCTGSNTAN